MSLPKVASKSKEEINFTSNFDRARIIFQEIESLLESELADTPQIIANYEQNVARVKSKRKRGGPFLIKPLNKSKARRSYAIFSLSPSAEAVNDMEFDPVLGVWVGNDEAMKNFAAHQPALIINKQRHDKPKTIGKMVWDPNAQKWVGNEEALRLFDKRKLPLISNLNKPGDIFSKGNGDMVFNSATMRWEGNESDAFDFGTISEYPSQDDGFVVGTEFQLSPATIQMFTECANRHKTNTSGWWRDEKTREHLLAIRTMSIIRVVRDVKRAMFSYYQEPADMDIAAEKEPPSKSPRSLTESREAVLEDWQDVGPFDVTPKIKLPTVSSVDIDEELSKEDKDKKFGSISRGSGKKMGILVDEEDWGDDFAEDLDKVLPNKIGNIKPPTPPNGLASASSSTNGAYTSSINLYTHGTVTQLGKGGAAAAVAAAAAGEKAEKKPFALLKADAPQRRSFQLLPTDVKKPKLRTPEPKRVLPLFTIPERYMLLGYEASDEDDEMGLEIPSEPLRLKLNRTAASEDEARDLLTDGDYPDSSSNPDEDFDDDEVEEESWEDVELPPTLGEPVTKRPEILHPKEQPKEEWDDFEIPSEKLALKVSQHKLQQHQHLRQQQQQPAKSKDEEESWDGIEIPDNFQLRLKRK